MHRFRHWFATALLDQGESMMTVKEAMRHRSVTSTEGYTKVRNGQRRLAITSLPLPTQRPTGN
jgi:site-specific recombinase XerD